MAQWCVGYRQWKHEEILRGRENPDERGRVRPAELRSIKDHSKQLEIKKQRSMATKIQIYSKFYNQVALLGSPADADHLPTPSSVAIRFTFCRSGVFGGKLAAIPSDSAASSIASGSFAFESIPSSFLIHVTSV